MTDECTNGCKSVYITLTVLIVLATILAVFVVLIVHAKRENPKVPVPLDAATHVSQPDYDIQIHDNFLSAEECNYLREQATPHLFDSAVYSSEEDVIDTNTRISKQCWLSPNYLVVQRIRDRLRKIIPNLNNSAFMEDVQVVQYKPGGFFKPHFDACVGTKEFCQRMDYPHGPRYITVLIYLNDEGLTGGNTVFPNINKKVTPKIGRAVVFYNVDRNHKIITEALHGGEPVLTGEKWIANQWIRIW